jgi:hypothetical protein
MTELLLALNASPEKTDFSLPNQKNTQETAEDHWKVKEDKFLADQDSIQLSEIIDKPRTSELKYLPKRDL